MPTLSPYDFQAFAAATGTDYPDTPAEKARLHPVVSAWKADQQQQQNSSISSSAIPIGATALGLALLSGGLYDAANSSGYTAPDAIAEAAGAQELTNDATARSLIAGRGEESVGNRPRANRQYTGPQLRAKIKPPGRKVAVNVPVAARVSRLGEQNERATGAYRARTDATAFHNPELRGLSPEQRSEWLVQKANELGAESDQFLDLLRQVEAIEAVNPPGVDPLSFIAAENAQARFGTTTAAEQAATGGELPQSRTKSNVSAQEGYVPRDSKPQWQALTREHSGDLRHLLTTAADSGPGDLGATRMNLPSEVQGAAQEVEQLRKPAYTGIDPSKAEVFYLDSDGTLQPWIGSSPIKGAGGSILYTGRKRPRPGATTGEPIRQSDLLFFPLDDPEHYRITGETHPYVSLEQIEQTAREKPDRRLQEDEDQLTKGMMETLPGGTTPAAGTLAAGPDSADLTSGQRARRRMSALLGRARHKSGVPVDGGASDSTVYGRVGGIDTRSRAYEVVNAYRDLLAARRQALGDPGPDAPAMRRDADTAGTRSIGVELDQLDAAAATRAQAQDDPFTLKPRIRPRRANTADGEALGYGASLEEIRDRAARRLIEARMGMNPRAAIEELGQQLGDKVLLDSSGFQSEMRHSGAVVAGERLLDHYLHGDLLEKGIEDRAIELSREYNTDVHSVVNVGHNLAVARSRAQRGQDASPKERVKPLHIKAHALGGRGNDPLDRVYTSLGMHAGAAADELEGFILSGNVKRAAEAMAPQIPGYTALLKSQSKRVGTTDEATNLVAEAISAGIHDLNVVSRKHPQMLDQFGLGKGAGGFSVGAFMKTYVRDYVTARSIEVDRTGKPVFQVPADAFDELAYEAHLQNINVEDALQQRVRGAATPLQAVLRLDRMVSSAQSTKEGDPNTNATRFAQAVFDLSDPEMLSTQIGEKFEGDIGLSFSARAKDEATAGFYSPNKHQPSDAVAQERLAEMTTLADGTKVPLGGDKINATLRARIKGTDELTTPGGTARKKAAQAALDWVAANAPAIEAIKTNLNRGLLATGDGGSTSIGRGLVLAAGPRGVHVAGDDGGTNTSLRDDSERFDLGDAPADWKEDVRADLAINNQQQGGVRESELAAPGPSLSSPDAAAGGELRQRLVAASRAGEKVDGLTAVLWAKEIADKYSAVPGAMDYNSVLRFAAEDPTPTANAARGSLEFTSLGPPVKAADGTTIRAGTGAMSTGQARRPLERLQSYLADMADARAQLQATPEPSPPPASLPPARDLSEEDAAWVYQEPGAAGRFTALSERPAPETPSRPIYETIRPLPESPTRPSPYGGTPYTRSDDAFYIDERSERIPAGEVDAPSSAAAAALEGYGSSRGAGFDMKPGAHTLPERMAQPLTNTTEGASRPGPTDMEVAYASHVGDWADKAYGAGPFAAGKQGLYVKGQGYPYPLVEPSARTLAGRIKSLRARGII